MRRSMEAHEGETAFHAIADAMPQLLWIAKADGTPEFFNKSWLDYVGMTAADAECATLSSGVHPQDVGRMWDCWRDAVASGSVFEMELRLRRAADGAYRWFLTRAQPIRDKAGTIVRWAGTATDIDPQRRAYESLDFVLQASTLLWFSRGIEEICTNLARLTVDRFADWCFIVLAEDSDVLRLAAVEDRDPGKSRQVRRYADSHPIRAGEALMRELSASEPLLIPVVSEQMLHRIARSDEDLELLLALDVHSAVIVPLRVDSQLLGAMVIASSISYRTFEQTDADVVRIVAERAAIAIHNARTLASEQRSQQRLRFVGRATEAIYESFDIVATFAELLRMIVAEFADFAALLRLEEGRAVRVIAAAHTDPEKDEILRSFIGVRPMQTRAEQRFAQLISAHQPVLRENVEPNRIAGTAWPYLAADVRRLQPRSTLTIPIYSRGTTYGAIVLYNSNEGRRFTEEEVLTLVEVGRHASIAMENAEVFERERRMTETLQDSLLPPSLPHVPGLRFDAVYLPSSSIAQVGGDWYDAFVLDDGSIVVSVGDVVGRGAEAAVIMGKVRHLLAIAPSYESDPARMLDTVESVLARRYPDAIVTAFVGIIDPARRMIRYANAGHPFPLLRRTNGIEELRAEGLPLGIRTTIAPAESRTMQLDDAKMLLLYTDGLIEAKRDVIAGQRTLSDVLRSDAILHTHSPARFVEESCLHGSAEDDVAILALSFETSMRWTFDAENAKAAQDARGEFVAYLRANAARAEDIATAELVFGELIGNVVRHAPGPIDIDLDWSSERPVLHVIDRGAAFDGAGSLPANLLSESGRGLFIVKRLSTRFHVEHVRGYGNHVTVELALHRKNPE